MGDSKSSMEVRMKQLCNADTTLRSNINMCSPINQVVGITAMACGMIAVGSCNGDVTSTILQTIMEKNDTELKDSYAHWLPLGLGLNHLGKNWPHSPQNHQE